MFQSYHEHVFADTSLRILLDFLISFFVCLFMISEVDFVSFLSAAHTPTTWIIRLYRVKRKFAANRKAWNEENIVQSAKFVFCFPFVFRFFAEEEKMSRQYLPERYFWFSPISSS